jgi:hypothetical protein
MMRVRLIFLTALLAIAALPRAENVDPLAGRPGTFLRMGAGSRAEAMGNAQTALLEPTTVVAYWNPAMAVMLSERHVLTSGYRFLTLGRRQGYLSYTNRVPPRMALSVAILYQGDHNIPIFDTDGNFTYTGGYMSLATHITLAYKLSKRLSLGLNTAIFTSTINAGTGDANKISTPGSSATLDLSAYYKLKSNFALGLNIKQVRGKSKWEVPTYGTEMNTVIAENLPTEVKLGAAWQGAVKGKACALTYDIDGFLVPLDDESLSWYSRYKDGRSLIEHHLGAECFIYPEFPLRLGISGNEGFTCGTGFYFSNGTFKGNKLDYVFTVDPNGSGVENGVSWTYSW